MITPYWLILIPALFLRFKTILDILIAFNEKYYDITIKYQQSLQKCMSS